jgi:hypothetical protein
MESVETAGSWAAIRAFDRAKNRDLGQVIAQDPAQARDWAIGKIEDGNDGGVSDHRLDLIVVPGGRSMEDPPEVALDLTVSEVSGTQEGGARGRLDRLTRHLDRHVVHVRVWYTESVDGVDRCPSQTRPSLVHVLPLNVTGGADHDVHHRLGLENSEIRRAGVARCGATRAADGHVEDHPAGAATYAAAHGLDLCAKCLPAP